MKNPPTHIPATPLEVLNFITKDRGITGPKLAKLIGIAPHLGDKLLDGSWHLSPKHAQTLGRLFNVSAQAFVPRKGDHDFITTQIPTRKPGVDPPPLNPLSVSPVTRQHKSHGLEERAPSEPPRAS